MMQYNKSVRIVEVAAIVVPMFRIEILNNSLVIYSDFVLLARSNSFALRLHIALDSRY